MPALTHPDRAAMHRQNRVNQYLSNPVKPAEYCEKWIAPHFYDLDSQTYRRGYRAECVRQLARDTGLSERTINNWGSNLEKHPDDPQLYQCLTQADALRQIARIGGQFFD